MIVRLAAIWAVISIGLAVPVPASFSQTAEPAQAADFDALHAAYLADDELQLERPEPQPPEPPEPPPQSSWLTSLADWLGSVISFFGPVFRVLFYLIVAGLVLWLLYFLFGESLNLRLDRFRKQRDGPVDSHVDDLRPDAAAARSLLDEADALAREGRYAEAVHLLLFRSIEDIQTRKAGGVPRSLTAREIGGLGDLPERARAALGPIIRIVERSFFGGREVDESGWRAARASYEDFAFGGGWS